MQTQWDVRRKPSPTCRADAVQTGCYDRKPQNERNTDQLSFVEMASRTVSICEGVETENLRRRNQGVHASVRKTGLDMYAA